LAPLLSNLKLLPYHWTNIGDVCSAVGIAILKAEGSPCQWHNLGNNGLLAFRVCTATALNARLYNASQLNNLSFCAAVKGLLQGGGRTRHPPKRTKVDFLDNGNNTTASRRPERQQSYQPRTRITNYCVFDKLASPQGRHKLLQGHSSHPSDNSGYIKGQYGL
jgi:hypothetical protein